MNPRNKKGETDNDKEKEPKRKISSAKKEEEPSGLAIASTSSDEIASEPDPRKSKIGEAPKKKLTVSTERSFKDILKASTFVDKTLFIKEVFQAESKEDDETDIVIADEHPKVMITVPRRFGKSVNLDMFRCFVELEVDKETGKQLTKFNQETATVSVTPNYTLFTKNENSEEMHLQIMADDEFVKTHFGKYPIINVNFLCNDNIASITDAVNFCKKRIHQAYNEHPYLYINSKSRLTNDERSVCKKWCTEEGNPNYQQFEPYIVTEGLKNLSNYLYKFHEREVFVLIDEFDSIVSKTVGTVADKDQLKKIIDVVMDVTSSVVKDNTILAGVLITGILDLHGTGLSSALGTLDRDKFGEDKPRLKYYGFNLDEVKKLFEIFSVPEALKKKAIAKYNGYYTKRGEHGIFNPYAIVSFLKNLKQKDASLQNYWQESGYVETLDNLFKKDNVKEMIQRMLQGKRVEVEPLDQLSLRNLTDLHIANRDSLAYISLDLVVYFLLRQGYISYTCKTKNLQTFFGIPDDLRPVFIRKMVEHLTQHCGLNAFAHKNCQNYLNNVMDVVDKAEAEFTTALKFFTDNLGELIDAASIDPCNEAGIETVVSSVVLAAGYTCASQVYTIDQNRLDVIAHKDGQGIIIELKYKAKSSRGALEQIFTQGYYKDFINKKHYDGSDIKLRLAMGLNFTEKKKGSKVKATVHCLRDVEINKVLKELNIEKVNRRTGTENKTEDRIASACANEGTNPFVEKAICVT